MFSKKVISAAILVSLSGVSAAGGAFTAEVDTQIQKVPTDPIVKKPSDGKTAKAAKEEPALESVTTTVQAASSSRVASAKPSGAAAQVITGGAIVSAAGNAPPTVPATSNVLVSTPAVPGPAVRDAGTQPSPFDIIQSAMSGKSAKRSSGPSEDGAIYVKPGETQVIQISKRALNRFVTPFKRVKIQTIDNIDAITDKGTVYISTQTDSPVGVYLVDEDTLEAISLELIPSQTPLQEVTLKLDPSYRPSMRPVVDSDQSNRQKAEPFVAGLSDVLKEISLGHIPAGFNLTSKADPDIGCFMPGIKISQEQLMLGTEEKVGVFVAENKAETALEISEQGCYSRGVEAVAAFPRVMLQPGEKTEIYVIKRILHESDNPLPERKILVK